MAITFQEFKAIQEANPILFIVGYDPETKEEIRIQLINIPTGGNPEYSEDRNNWHYPPTDKDIYIRFVKGTDTGPAIRMDSIPSGIPEYSADGENWHYPYEEGDLYGRINVGEDKGPAFLLGKSLGITDINGITADETGKAVIEAKDIPYDKTIMDDSTSIVGQAIMLTEEQCNALLENVKITVGEVPFYSQYKVKWMYQQYGTIHNIDTIAKLKGFANYYSTRTAIWEFDHIVNDTIVFNGMIVAYSSNWWLELTNPTTGDTVVLYRLNTPNETKSPIGNWENEGNQYHCIAEITGFTGIQTTVYEEIKTLKTQRDDSQYAVYEETSTDPNNRTVIIPNAESTVGKTFHIKSKATNTGAVWLSINGEQTNTVHQYIGGNSYQLSAGQIRKDAIYTVLGMLNGAYAITGIQPGLALYERFPGLVIAKDSITEDTADHIVPKMLAIRGLRNNVLQKNNTAEYIPTLPYHPATKKYVDDSIGNIPSGANNLIDVSEMFNIPTLAHVSAFMAKRDSEDMNPIVEIHGEDDSGNDSGLVITAEIGFGPKNGEYYPQRQCLDGVTVTDQIIILQAELGGENGLITVPQQCKKFNVKYYAALANDSKSYMIDFFAVHTFSRDDTEISKFSLDTPQINGTLYYKNEIKELNFGVDYLGETQLNDPFLFSYGNLQRLNLKGLKNVTYIVEGSFCDLPSLRYLDLSVFTLENGIIGIGNNSGFSTLFLPNFMENPSDPIIRYSFNDCVYLKLLSMKGCENITNIETSFINIEQLEDLNLSFLKSINFIEESFLYMPNLKRLSMNIPVDSIRMNNSFNALEGLEFLDLTNLPVSNYQECFNDCFSLKEIQIGGNMSKWEQIEFSNCFQGITNDSSCILRAGSIEIADRFKDMIGIHSWTTVLN